MEEIDQILIQRYLAGELTASERLDLEQRMKDDLVFGQEVLEYEMARQALRLKEREQLRQRFAKRDELLDKKKPEGGSPGRNRFIWLWVVATVVVALLMWRFLFPAGQKKSPTNIESKEPARLDQATSTETDTFRIIDPKDKGGIIEKEKTPNQQDLAKADARKKGGELFAEYYDPYKDAMMDPTTRGDEELSTLQKYQKAYWDGEYLKAVESFSGLTQDQQANDNYRFSYANALLATGKTEQAISVLEMIIKNNRSKYFAEAHYELAMGYLKKGDPTNAKKWLLNYIKLEKAKRKEKANEIIRKL